MGAIVVQGCVEGGIRAAQLQALAIELDGIPEQQSVLCLEPDLELVVALHLRSIFAESPCHLGTTPVATNSCCLAPVLHDACGTANCCAAIACPSRWPQCCAPAVYWWNPWGPAGTRLEVLCSLLWGALFCQSLHGNVVRVLLRLLGHGVPEQGWQVLVVQCCWVLGGRHRLGALVL